MKNYSQIANCMKFILTGSLLLTGLVHCEVEDDKMLNNIERLVGDRKLFYHGLYGWIARDVYIRHDDTMNNFYSKDKCVHFGGEKKKVEVYKLIEKEDGVNFEKLGMIPKEPNGTIVVFTPKIVYLLQFDLKKFGKYYRDFIKADD